VSPTLRVEIGTIMVAGQAHDDPRLAAELRAELAARVATALAQADRSGLLWTDGSGRGTGGLDQEVVGRLVSGAVAQAFEPAEEQ